jgi:hypothetical protein
VHHEVISDCLRRFTVAKQSQSQFERPRRRLHTFVLCCNIGKIEILKGQLIVDARYLRRIKETRKSVSINLPSVVAYIIVDIIRMIYSVPIMYLLSFHRKYNSIARNLEKLN